MRAVLLWLGPAWLEHAAGTLRAIGLAFFLAALLAGESVKFDLVASGAIILVLSPFVARAAKQVDRTHGPD